MKYGVNWEGKETQQWLALIIYFLVVCIKMGK